MCLGKTGGPVNRCTKRQLRGGSHEAGSEVALGKMVVRENHHNTLQGGPPTSYKWSYNPYK